MEELHIAAGRRRAVGMSPGEVGGSTTAGLRVEERTAVGVRREEVKTPAGL